MESYKLFEAEFRFMEVIWQNEPLTSAQLVQLCEERFGWKKSTTFTQLKRLGERGFLVNEQRVVTALVKREQVEKYESAAVLSSRFEGSLPKFVAAFLDTKKMTIQEANEIRRLLDEYEGEE